MFKKYNCIRQFDVTDCGAACLATVTKHYGLKLHISSIREIAGTDEHGTNLLGLVKAAQSIGFNAKGVKGNKDAIFSKFPLPAIAHVKMENGLLHYLVIHSIKKDSIIIADPAVGIVKYTIDNFIKIWTGNLVIIEPNNNFKAIKDDSGILIKIVMFLKLHRNLLFYIFISSILYTALGILGAFYIKILIDDIIPNEIGNNLLYVSLGVLVISVIKILSNAIRTHLTLQLSQKIDLSLILGYYNHVIDLPLNFFGTRKIGEIVSRFTDASKIRDAISSATFTIMIDTLMVLVGGLILYNYNSHLFTLAFVMVFLYCIIVSVFNKPLNEINQKQMEANSQLTSFLVESLNGIETIKSYNAENYSKQKTKIKFTRLLSVMFKMGTLENVRNTLTNLIGTVGGIIILWAGAIKVINGELTVGELLVFNSLLVYFIDPVKNLINLQPMIQKAVVASKRLEDILKLEIEKSINEDKKIKPSTLKGNIKIENLYFKYDSHRLVLKNIDIEIIAGEKVAFVGESGCGKTTLVKLLMNFYSPMSGRILINDTNVIDINLELLRERIAYIQQNTFLFSGSVEDNIKFNSENVDISNVIDAAKKSKADEFICHLPQSYSTYIEENGANLSGGQRQKLSITRAILKNPDILILDEATSNLDSLSEKAIEKTINELHHGGITIIIAHRLSTVMSCDKIFVMENGEIIENGNHESLLSSQGKYYKLWQEQLPD